MGGQRQRRALADDPAAAEDFIAPIANRRLPGRDGPLGRVKPHTRGSVFTRIHGGRRAGMRVADLDRRLERLAVLAVPERVDRSRIPP